MGRLCGEHIKMGRPSSGTLSKEGSNLASQANTAGPRKTFAFRSSAFGPGGAHGIAYFEPTVTVSWLRPRRRRRVRVLRPARVFIRARKPCLFRRFRFLGLYVGFIRVHLDRNDLLRDDVKQGKVSGFSRASQGEKGATIYLTNPGYRYIFMVVGEPPPKESNDGQKTQTPQDFDRRSPLLR